MKCDLCGRNVDDNKGEGDEILCFECYRKVKTGKCDLCGRNVDDNRGEGNEILCFECYRKVNDIEEPKVVKPAPAAKPVKPAPVPKPVISDLRKSPGTTAAKPTKGVVIGIFLAVVSIPMFWLPLLFFIFGGSYLALFIMIITANSSSRKTTKRLLFTISVALHSFSSVILLFLDGLNGAWIGADISPSTAFYFGIGLMILYGLLQMGKTEEKPT